MIIFGFDEDAKSMLKYFKEKLGYSNNFWNEKIDNKKIL